MTFMKIFRPDLKLNEKRRHRLVKVLWIFSIIIMIVWWFSFLMYSRHTFDYVESLKHRLKDKWYSTAKELLFSSKEYISYSCKDYPITYVLDYSDYDNLEWMFCSKNWSTQSLQEISNKTKLDYESNHSIWWVQWNWSVWPINDVIKYWNPELCIVKTKIWHELLRFQWVFWDNLCIVKPINKIITWIKLLFIILAYILITILIYYKVIIYIIYGSKKNKGKLDA